MADNIFQRIKKVFVPEKRSITYDYTTAIGLPYSQIHSPLSTLASMQLSVVYRCVDVVSDAIASQNWEHLEYKNGGWNKNEFSNYSFLLNRSPNPGMSKFNLFKTAISQTLLNGNGWIYIERPYAMADPKALYLVNYPVNTYLREDGTVYHIIKAPNKDTQVEDNDMLHFMKFSYNGYAGVSVLTHAYNSLGLANASEQSAKGFFASGANANLVITTEIPGKLTKEKATDIKNSFRDAIGSSSGDANGYSGGIAVVEGGLKIQPISVNPKDAQLLETRQFNVIDLCRFFGVHPSKAFDNTNLTYSNIESFQLGFLTDTASPWDCNIESELNRKLLRPSLQKYNYFNLDISQLLRANMDARANYVSKMFQSGGYTVNEVRKECGNPPKEGGDKAYVQINMLDINAPPPQVKPLDKKVAKPEEEPETKSKKDKKKEKAVIDNVSTT
jgi:HK97 family phage portal protein